MKKFYILALMFCISIFVFVGCDNTKIEYTDISDSVKYTTQNGYAVLTGFDSNEKNISVSDTLNGVPVELILSSFAEGKTLKNVKLPQAINSFVRIDGELALCKSTIENSVLLDKGNMSQVFCEFFGTDSITVNGVKYSTGAEASEIDLSGEWKNVDVIFGVKHIQTYTFSDDGTVTCTADGETFSGTYELKDGKLFVVLGDDSAEFEIIGETLVCWEHGISLSTKDATDYAQQSDTGWDYIVTPSGYAQLTGYRGNDEVVAFPVTVDGYEVGSIHSSVADTYNFKEITYNGHGNIRFAGQFNLIHYNEQTDDYILYTWVNTDGNAIKQLTVTGFGGTTSIAAEAYCRFFKTDKITIDGREYTSDTAKSLTEEDVIGRWRPIPDHNRAEMLLALHAGGLAELHSYASEEQGDCTKCRTGTYSISGTTVNVTFDDGTLRLEYFGSMFISWAENDLLLETTARTEVVEFKRSTREGWKEPFVHITPITIVDKYIPFTDDTQMLNYLSFNADGSATVTLAHLDWFDKTVTYTFKDERTVILSDGAVTETLILDMEYIEDTVGNGYWPEWQKSLN